MLKEITFDQWLLIFIAFFTLVAALYQIIRKEVIERNDKKKEYAEWFRALERCSLRIFTKQKEEC